MAKLYFRHGTVGCSKTANALMVAYNYEERGLKPLLIKPLIDTRDGERIISSRIGLKRGCLAVEDVIPEDAKDISAILNNFKDYDCIIVDEVQFCTVEQTYVFRAIVDILKIPVICYGLMDDFKLIPFEASANLAALADVVERLKSVCWCGDGAQCNTRLDGNGNIVTSGDKILLGGNDRYTSLCRKHYFEKNLGPKIK